MDESKMNFTAVLMNHIINNYEWTKQLGHYVYYKEHMKKPPKKRLNIVDKKYMYDLISKINKDLEIDDVFKSLNKNKCGKVYEKSSKTNKINNKNKNIYVSNIIEEENDGNIIKLSPDYKFTGVNPYDDLKQPENMPDFVFKEMIYLRSQFSKSKFSKFQYSFSEDFILS